MSDLKKYLEEVKLRMRGITPGPWQHHTGGHYSEKLSREIISVPKMTSICDMVFGTEYDRDFIVNAPTDIARLIEEVERLLEKLELLAGGEK